MSGEGTLPASGAPMVVPFGTVVETLVQAAPVLAGATLPAQVIVTASFGVARPQGKGLVHIVAFTRNLLVSVTVGIDSTNATGGTMGPRFVAISTKAEASIDEGSPVRVEVSVTQRFVASGVGTPLLTYDQPKWSWP